MKNLRDLMTQNKTHSFYLVQSKEPGSIIGERLDWTEETDKKHGHVFMIPYETGYCSDWQYEEDEYGHITNAKYSCLLKYNA